jgi:hypothetical protein
MSIAADVRTAVEGLSVRSFIRTRDVEGPRAAVEQAFSRLTVSEELLRVRHGLYWKGPKTRFGMLKPTPLETALEVAGPGSGPAGVAASRVFGLTTQVPSVVEVAVPRRAPHPLPGIQFTTRSVERVMEDLGPVEVAALEVLRSWPSGTEKSFERFEEELSREAVSGRLRPDRIRAVIDKERTPGARELWTRVEEDLAFA